MKTTILFYIVLCSRTTKRFFKKLFNIRHDYFIEPFIYVDKQGNVKDPMSTDRVKWLEKMTINHWTEIDAEKEAINILERTFPAYKHKICLF